MFDHIVKVISLSDSRHCIFWPWLFIWKVRPRQYVRALSAHMMAGAAFQPGDAADLLMGAYIPPPGTEVSLLASWPASQPASWPVGLSSSYKFGTYSISAQSLQLRHLLTMPKHFPLRVAILAHSKCAVLCMMAVSRLTGGSHPKL